MNNIILVDLSHFLLLFNSSFNVCLIAVLVSKDCVGNTWSQIIVYALNNYNHTTNYYLLIIWSPCKLQNLFEWNPYCLWQHVSYVNRWLFQDKTTRDYFKGLFKWEEHRQTSESHYSLLFLDIKEESLETNPDINE